MAKKSVNLKDDDEIYRELRELGLKFGPITDSTRSLYLKKLDAAL
ncbi:LEM domain protein, partial [Trichinella nativa]